MKLTVALLVTVPATVFGKDQSVFGKDLSAFKSFASKDDVLSAAGKAIASLPNPQSSLGAAPEGFNADVIQFSTSKVTDRVDKDRKLRGSNSGGSRSGKVSGGSGSGSSKCNFIAHLYDPNDGTAYLQVHNGEISAFNQIINDDDDYLSICDNTKCAGDGLEVSFVADGSCSGGDAYLQFSVYTADTFDGGSPSTGTSEVYFSCPEATQEASALCKAFDGTQALTGTSLPTINYDSAGPIVYIDFADSENYLYGCTVSCDGQSIDLF